MNKLKIIKFIVFLLTFFLFLGILSAATIVYKKLKTPTENIDITLNQPKGSYIESYKINDKKIYILVKNTNISDRIIVVDQASQSIITTIKTN